MIDWIVSLASLLVSIVAIVISIQQTRLLSLRHISGYLKHHHIRYMILAAFDVIHHAAELDTSLSLIHI